MGVRMKTLRVAHSLRESQGQHLYLIDGDNHAYQRIAAARI
jgi:hypothetical protein